MWNNYGCNQGFQKHECGCKKEEEKKIEFKCCCFPVEEKKEEKKCEPRPQCCCHCNHRDDGRNFY